MRTSKFTEPQIVATLKQADAGVPVKETRGQKVILFCSWGSDLSARGVLGRPGLPGPSVRLS